jgi:prolyl-tRNA synthetase
VVLDDRNEYTPGWKFNQWELKGVPIRIELGPRDLKQGQVVMVRRDTCQKTPVKEVDIPLTVEKLLQEIQDNMLSKAKAVLQEKTASVMTYEEFKRVLDANGGFLKAAWCGSAECEAKVKEETGATIRVRPFEVEEPKTSCIVCGEKARETVYFARSY